MCKTFDINQIKERTDKLETISNKLKNDFVGLDEIIDKFINSIKIWFILPEVQTRPLIVNLWGMTGLGKTDLIRKFVKYIEFTDRFAEIQMDSDSVGYQNKIQDYIDNILDSTNEQGVLLLDEIQRFRTIDDSGHEIRNNKYNDLWMLLSDGKFESDSKNRRDIFDMIASILFNIDTRESEKILAPVDNNEKCVTNESVLSENRKYKTYIWRAKEVKKLLKLEVSIDEIMKWDESKILEELQKGLKNKTSFEGSTYSKLLIIISGNLDEAFRMADDVDNVDTDADIFYEQSKLVNFINIKSSLVKRFKPEQIARFGNIHIIYPSLSRDSFMKIIKQKIDIIIAEIKLKHCINISVDESVYNVIYNNGVFPTQGVRPLLSTISSIFENSLPYFIYHALLNECDNFGIKCVDGDLISDNFGSDIKYSIPRVIDDIRSSETEDDIALYAVHEAGHAVTYSLLFGVPPKQISARTADSDNGGFIMIHNNYGTKLNYINKIRTLVSGYIAERIVFGNDKKTDGCIIDVKLATTAAAVYVRKIVNSNIKAYVETDDAGAIYYHDYTKSNDLIEHMISDAEEKVTELLNQNIDFFKTIVSELIEYKEITPYRFIEIGKQFNKKFNLLHNTQKINEDFKGLVTNFLNN